MEKAARFRVGDQALAYTWVEGVQLFGVHAIVVGVKDSEGHPRYEVLIDLDLTSRLSPLQELGAEDLVRIGTLFDALDTEADA